MGRTIHHRYSLLLHSTSVESLRSVVATFNLNTSVVDPCCVFVAILNRSRAPLGGLCSTLAGKLRGIVSAVNVRRLENCKHLFSTVNLRRRLTRCLGVIGFFKSGRLSFDFDTLGRSTFTETRSCRGRGRQVKGAFDLFPQV